VEAELAPLEQKLAELRAAIYKGLTPLQRVQVARMILDRRRQQSEDRPHRAWPRNLNGMTCPHCDFAAFCLQNTLPDLNHPPMGFRVGAANEDLDQPAVV
jgi:hypothetical protein